MSVWHTPHATSRTSASPALGSARSTSVTCSGLANSSSTAARIFMVRILSRGYGGPGGGGDEETHARNGPDGERCRSFREVHADYVGANGAKRSIYFKAAS